MGNVIFYHYCTVSLGDMEGALKNIYIFFIITNFLRLALTLGHSGEHLDVASFLFPFRTVPVYIERKPARGWIPPSIQRRGGLIY